MPGKPWTLGVMAAAVMTACATSPSGSRSVRILPPAGSTAAARFEPAQSTGLFIGVRRFTRPNTLKVPYAADDAVDLAYMFALHPRVRLVPPDRVVIALMGRPQKAESQRKLAELKAAGATEVKADRQTIVAMLQRQAAAAGKDGMFIVSLATHGYVRHGTPYILGSDNELSTARIFDIASTSPARRSLIFIDACRERIVGGRRGLAPDPGTAAPLMSRMGRIEGLVVFYAATANKWAYDGDGNGVFTKNVLDGLNCNAAAVRDVVTVATLRRYVERETLRWIREHRDPNLGAATQVSIDGRSDAMPLSHCSVGPALQDQPAESSQPAARHALRFIVVRTATGERFVFDFDGNVLRALPAPGTNRSQAALLSHR